VINLRTILLTLLYFSRPISSVTETNLGYPAKTMDYKIQVDAGKEECVFQFTNAGFHFFVDFHVIRGGDGQASFTVRDPNGIIVLPYEWKSQASYETENSLEGYYTVCVDNQYSRFAGKVVSIYMATYEAAGWERYSADLEKADVNIRVFTRNLAMIAKSISSMIHLLHQSKSFEARDYAILSDNNYNIGFWSSVQCIIMLGSGVLHVYIIRRLFRETPSGGKFNARL